MANHSLESITLGTANIATGVTAGTGMITFLNENAAAISVVIAFVSLLIASVFYILNYRLKLKATDMYREEILNDIIHQIKNQATKEGMDHNDLINVVNKKVKERRCSSHKS